MNPNKSIYLFRADYCFFTDYDHTEYDHREEHKPFYDYYNFPLKSNSPSDFFYGDNYYQPFYKELYEQ